MIIKPEIINAYWNKINTRPTTRWEDDPLIWALTFEIDEYRRRALTRHFPHVQRLGDIYDIRNQQIPPADIVAGGTPCQGYHRAASLKMDTRKDHAT